MSGVTLIASTYVTTQLFSMPLPPLIPEADMPHFQWFISQAQRRTVWISVVDEFRKRYPDRVPPKPDRIRRWFSRKRITSKGVFREDIFKAALPPDDQPHQLVSLTLLLPSTEAVDEKSEWESFQEMIDNGSIHDIFDECREAVEEHCIHDIFDECRDHNNRIASKESM